MNSHSFLKVDYHSSVSLSYSQEKKLKSLLNSFSTVGFYLIKKKIIPTHNLKQIQVSLLICGDTRMRSLNAKFRKKNKTTDILSFPAVSDLRQVAYSQSTLFLGDLAISFPQLKRQAKKFSIKWSDEFIHLFFHGFIHLLGFDHEKSRDEEKLMEFWEGIAINKMSEIQKATAFKKLN